jgi:hypothetical protein
VWKGSNIYIEIVVYERGAEESLKSEGRIVIILIGSEETQHGPSWKAADLDIW